MAAFLPTRIPSVAKSKWAKLGLALLILNEIRGLAVVGSIVLAWAKGVAS
jgi:hypothetical protein